MMQRTLFRAFEQLADAPGGVKHLRELIFELAATGRLVAGGMQLGNELLGNVAEFVMGQAPPGNECNTTGKGTLFVKAGEFGPLYPVHEAWTDKPLKFAKLGDVLICVVGATVGKLNLGIDSAIGRSVAALRPGERLRTKYLYYVLMPYVLRLRRGSRGSAQGVIGKDDLGKIQIRVPLLPEQDGIVAKVDELMALCDDLEARQTTRSEARRRLHAATLHHVTSARSPSELAAHWSRLRTHFDPLHATPDSIPALRQTILQLAIQGRLATQSPEDDSAGTDINRIEKERFRLIQKQILRPAKPLAEADAGDFDFDLPSGWAATRFGVVALNIVAGSSPNCLSRRREGVEWGVLKISAVSWDEFDPEENKALPANVEPDPDDEVKPGDFIMSRANTAELVAKSVVVRETPPRLLLNDKTLRVRFSEHTESRFLNLLNNSPYARAYYARVASGTSASMKNIGREGIATMPIALPPLAEQKRIVAKVEQLLALCDELETRLKDADARRARLLTAAIHDILQTTHANKN